MSNIALIFAGGTGQRMNSKTKPKQFLELHGKPIIIYTLEVFENHEEIDSIVIACLEQWIPYLADLTEKYHISKVKSIVPGGNTGQLSIYNAVERAHEIFSGDSIVLVHDGVRPLIDEVTIHNNIECVRKNGCAITVTPAVETVVIKDNDGCVENIMDRSRCELARAPQSFFLDEFYMAHQRAKQEDLLDFIDSAHLMNYYGKKLFTVEGPLENIKITTPTDYYIFRALEDERENSQIFGL